MNHPSAGGSTRALATTLFELVSHTLGSSLGVHLANLTDSSISIDICGRLPRKLGGIWLATRIHQARNTRAYSTDPLAALFSFIAPRRALVRVAINTRLINGQHFCRSLIARRLVSRFRRGRFAGLAWPEPRNSLLLAASLYSSPGALLITVSSADGSPCHDRTGALYAWTYRSIG